MRNASTQRRRVAEHAEVEWTLRLETKRSQRQVASAVVYGTRHSPLTTLYFTTFNFAARTLLLSIICTVYMPAFSACTSIMISASLLR